MLAKLLPFRMADPGAANLHHQPIAPTVVLAESRCVLIMSSAPAVGCGTTLSAYQFNSSTGSPSELCGQHRHRIPEKRPT